VTGAFLKNILCGALFLLLCACAQKPPETLRLAPISFDALEGWTKDNQQEALPAFQKSCDLFEKRDPSRPLKMEEAGLMEDWQNICAHLALLQAPDAATARAFFESWFTPYRVTAPQETGLFTGYYQAQLRGSLTQDEIYTTPLWAAPEDMITADLGLFRDSLKGQKITGKVSERKLVPYDTRAEIADGALGGRAQPLVYVDDPIGAFFLEIQGSGQIRLPDGSIIALGYAAQNGHGYTPIGRILLEREEIERPVSMQKIRAWLTANPAQQQEVMNKNASVVFFQIQGSVDAIGAQGVGLTPLRSLAVDPSYIPLGIPLWLVTPQKRQLVIAQDIGGAIKGAVRGDLFWGAGPYAEDQAGTMQYQGYYVLLLPKTIADRP